MDLVISLSAIIILSPVMAIVAIIVRLAIGSPVIFRQTRAGWHGKPFEIYKFRTMTTQTDAEGNLLPDHLRLTRTGIWLRKLSLDELPQLFNVVKGDLSLVGPRPLLMEYVHRYTPEQARRLEVKPGITGWAQVNGRNAISWEEKFRLDVWYADNRSLWLDLRILLLTVWQVMTSRGISADGHATMPEFRGQSVLDKD